MKRLSFLAALACAALMTTAVAAAPAFAQEPVKNDLSAAPAAVGLANTPSDDFLKVNVSGANVNDDSGAIVALVQYRYGSNYDIGLTAAPPLIATAMTYDAGRSPRANLANVDGRFADSLRYAGNADVFKTLNAAALGIAASG